MSIKSFNIFMFSQQSKSFAALSVSALVVSSLFSPFGFAQAKNVGLIISPSINEIDTERGNNYTVDLTIQNDDESSDYTLSTSTETFQASQNEGTPELRVFSPNETQKNWVTFSEKRFELKKGDKKNIKVDVSIPLEAKPGSYYFALIITNEKTPAANNSRVLIRERITSLLFVNVKGQVEREVNWLEFSTDKSFYDPIFDPINLIYRLELKGQGYFKPSGNIYLQTSPDNRISDLPLNPDQKIILPNSSRSFNIGQKATWNQQGLTDTDLNSKLTENSTNFKLPWFGKYTLQAKVNFVNSQGDIEAKTVSKDIFVFPWKLGLIILILLVIIAAVSFVVIKKVNKNKTKSASDKQLQS